MSKYEVTAVAICRVATEIQDQNRNELKRQKREIAVFAKNNDIKIKAWFTVGTNSRSYLGKGMPAVRHYCTQNSVDYVIATDATRISRFYTDFEKWEESLADIGVWLMFTRSPWQEHDAILDSMQEDEKAFQSLLAMVIKYEPEAFNRALKEAFKSNQNGGAKKA